MLCSLLFHPSHLPGCFPHSHCLSALSLTLSCRDAAGLGAHSPSSALCQRGGSLSQCSHVLVLPANQQRSYTVTLSCPSLALLLLPSRTECGDCQHLNGFGKRHYEVQGSHVLPLRGLCRSNSASLSLTANTGAQKMSHRSHLSQCMPERSKSLPSVTLPPHRRDQLK